MPHSQLHDTSLITSLRRNFTYEDVNVTTAETIADVCARVGVPRFVHVSHLNAEFDSPSKFYHTKAIGEEVVRDAFPDATIVRPAAMFGWEDKLLNKLYRTSCMSLHPRLLTRSP